MADPILINWIKKAAGETGADPVALLATSLQESGGRLHPKPGDQGTSFGPFQFHIGGALGTHSPAWASTYAAVFNRAREFARLKVRGGRGAAAVQRPADRVGYAQGVDSLLAQAHALLNGVAAAPSPGSTGTAPGTAATPAIPGHLVNILSGPEAALRILNAKSAGAALLEFQNARQKVRIGARPAVPASRGTLGTTPAAMGGQGSPINGKHTLIGLPYQGTHKLYGNWESDNAIDIQVPAHTPVYATVSGIIGQQFGHIGGGDAHMAGQRLHLDGGGNQFYYQHLASIVVKPGQRIQRGQLLGYTGALNHLHFASKNGDPRAYYK